MGSQIVNNLSDGVQNDNKNNKALKQYIQTQNIDEKISTQFFLECFPNLKDSTPEQIEEQKRLLIDAFYKDIHKYREKGLSFEEIRAKLSNTDHNIPFNQEVLNLAIKEIEIEEGDLWYRNEFINLDLEGCNEVKSDNDLLTLEEIRGKLSWLSPKRAKQEKSCNLIGWMLKNSYGDLGYSLWVDWIQVNTILTRETIENEAQALWSNFFSNICGFQMDMKTLDDWVENDSRNMPRIILRNAAYFMQPLPPKKWIVENLIGVGTFNIFFGESGSKKTYSLVHLSTCIALGHDWLNFKTNKCNVLIIDEENGTTRMHERTQQCNKAEGGDKSTPVTFISYARFKFDEKDDIDLLKKQIEITQAKVVVIDSLSQVMSGDENSKKDAQVILDNLRLLAEVTGCAIILIHHSGKNGLYRGSSTIKASVDLMVNVVSKDDSSYVDFISEKTRDLTPLHWAAEAKFGSDTFCLKPTEKKEKVQKYSDSQQYVIRFLTDHGPSKKTDIQNNADVCSPKAAENAIYKLAKLEKIKRVNPGVKGVEAMYDLVPE